VPGCWTAVGHPAPPPPPPFVGRSCGGPGAVGERAVEQEGVGETGHPDQPAHPGEGADDPARPAVGREFPREVGERAQAGGVPEARAGEIDDDLPGAQAGRLHERIGNERCGGEVRVAGQADDDLVGSGDECDIELGHGASGIFATATGLASTVE
jgi:hypothetical protein